MSSRSYSKKQRACPLGLDWKEGDYAGRTVVYHGGMTEGFVSLTAFLPDQNVGIALLYNTNSAHFHLLAVLTHMIFYQLLVTEEKEWMAEQKLQYAAKIAVLPLYEITGEAATYVQNLEGRYTNSAYGELELRYCEGYPSLFFHGLA